MDLRLPQQAGLQGAALNVRILRFEQGKIKYVGGLRAQSGSKRC